MLKSTNGGGVGLRVVGPSGETDGLGVCTPVGALVGLGVAGGGTGHHSPGVGKRFGIGVGSGLFGCGVGAGLGAGVCPVRDALSVELVEVTLLLDGWLVGVSPVADEISVGGLLDGWLVGALLLG